jgi:toxin ParE1/3/4
MRVLLRHPLVRADLLDAFNWYEDQLPGLGIEFERDFRNHVRRLPDDAWLYTVRFADVRRLNLDHFPYGIFYAIREPEIWLLAVLHGSRDTVNTLAERRRHFVA